MKQFKNGFPSLDSEGMLIPDSWKRLQKITEGWGGVFMVIGGVSSGKSTFVRFLTSFFLKRDKKIAIIDADIGQSWIGPPTTVSAIILSGKKREVNLMRPDLMEFVGVLSPSADIPAYLRAVQKIFYSVKMENPFAIIVDTTGLIAGNEGLNLKLKKAEILSPTTIIAFRKDGEIEHIINGLTEKRFNVYVINSPKETKERSMNQRREYREEIFRRYFEGGKIIRVKTSEENFENNSLVGILNNKKDTLALGIVIGKEGKELLLFTPLGETKEPIFLKKSSIKISMEGKEI